MTTTDPVRVEDATPTAKRKTLGYNPSLDGIRAIAVIGVLLYHGNLSSTPGGFLGVDVFFVLSGYLITSLLILEHDSTKRVALREFWLRRIRRLVPALLVVLVMVAAYAAFAADPTQRDQLRGDGLAALFYVANWRFILEGSSYFDQFQAPSPFRHMWSLAIEEQWYLFWPIVVSLLLTNVKASTKQMARGIFGAAVASALLMSFLYDPSTDPSRVYYGTDTRAQTLLVGAALAFLLTGRRVQNVSKAVLHGVGLAGALVCAVMFAVVHDRDAWMYEGGFGLLAIAAAAVIMVCALPEQTVLRTAMSWKPLVFVGKISYGLYLYHWPVYVFLDPERTGLSGTILLAVRLFTTLAISLLSYSFLEMPIRTRTWQKQWGPQNSKWVFSGAVAAAMLLLIVGTAGAREEEGPVNVVGVREGDQVVMVIGDSTANALAENFDPTKHSGVSVIAAGFPGCGVMGGQRKPPGEPAEPARCAEWPTLWQRRVERNKPDVSLLMVGNWESFPHIVDGEQLDPGTPAFEAYLHEQLDTAVSILRDGGSEVVLLLPYCYRPMRFDDRPVVYTDELHRAVHAMFASYGAEHPDTVTTIDLGEFVCPGGTFRDEIDGANIFRDGVHLNAHGGEVVWSWLLPQLTLTDAAPQ